MSALTYLNLDHHANPFQQKQLLSTINLLHRTNYTLEFTPNLHQIRFQNKNLEKPINGGSRVQSPLGHQRMDKTSTEIRL